MDIQISVGDKEGIEILQEMENHFYSLSLKIPNIYVLIKIQKFHIELQMDHALENGVVLI